MIISDPLNIKPLNPDKYFAKYQSEGISREVTSQLIFEPSSTVFHNTGLYSEEIFGQIGTEQRLSRIGYISINTKVLAPLVYKNIKDLRSIYLEIMAGKTYAKFNTETKQFDILSKDTEGSETGYSFFMSHFDELEFTETASVSTKNKIKMITRAKADGCATVDKCMVLPAGLRDVKQTDGRVTVEEINKLYVSLLSIAEGLKFDIDNTLFEKFYDGLKYSAQLKLFEIYEYMKAYFTDKRGFGQSKYASRSIAYGTRNVISASEMIGKSTNDQSYHKNDETIVPLFEVCKMYQPIIIHSLRTQFFGQVFTYGTTQVSVIDPNTLENTYVEVDDNEVTKYMGSEFYEDLINKFQDTHMRDLPVTITGKDGNEYYTNLVYDLGNILYFFNGLSSFKNLADVSKLNIKTVRKLPHLSLLESSGIKRSDVIFIDRCAIVVQGDLSPTELILTVLVNEETKNTLVEYFSTLSDITVSTVTTRGDGPTYTAIRSGDLPVIHIFTNEPYTKKDYSALVTGSEPINGYYVLTKETLSSMKKHMPEQMHSLVDNLTINESGFDKSKIRPLTYLEMFYLAACIATKGKFASITRYPAIETGSIYVSRVKVGSTIPSRRVTVELQFLDNESYSLPNYPVFNDKGKVDVDYLDSLLPHATHLVGLGGDYDGDMVNCNGIMSENACNECDEYLKGSGNFVTTSGSFLKSAETAMTKLTFFNLSRRRKK